MTNDGTIARFVRDVILSAATPLHLRQRALNLYACTGSFSRASIEIGHAVWRPDYELYNEIENFMVAGYKIKAIKRLRELTGCSLKDAKDAIEDPRNFTQPDNNDNRDIL